MDSVGLATQLGAKAGLGILLAVAFVGGLRRLPQLRSPLAGRRSRLRVLENVTLGQNRSLHVIEVGSRALLIASTSSSVSLLADVTDEAALDSSSAEAEGPAPAGFAAIVSRLLHSPDAGGLDVTAGRLQAAAQALRAGGGRP